MSFELRIRQLREEIKASQQDVADAIGVARATYANWETGKRDPNLGEINRLAEYYQISPAELISGDIMTVNEPLAPYEFEERNDIIPREDVILNVNKLRQVLLYISEKVGAKPNVGATVINKLLYFIDFDYYEKYGKSVTGLTYIRNHFGPTAHITTINSVIECMQKDEELDVVETDYFKHKQKKYLPRKSADLTELNAQELEHINEVLERLGSKKATDLSELSHKDMPWLATKPGEAINYQLAMYRTAATSVRGKDDVEI